MRGATRAQGTVSGIESIAGAYGTVGQAKLRAAQIEALKNEHALWRSALSEHEQEIVRVAECLADRIVVGKRFTEACYHLAFFMAEYLGQEGIIVDPVVGWINDTHWEGVASHAWVEYNGLKVDVSLIRTSNRAAQPYGELIILDRVMSKGDVSYRYYKDGSVEAEAGLRHVQNDPSISSAGDFKLIQHRQMQEIAQTRGFSEYLRSAPIGGRFDDLARMIDRP